MMTRGRMLTGLALSALALLAGVSSLSAERVESAPAVMAVDALGKPIGVVLKMDYSARNMQVALEVNDTLVPVLVRKNSFSHGSRPVVYFQSPGCTGPAYLAADPGNKMLGPPVGVAGPRGTLYWGYPDTEKMNEVASAMWGAECREFATTLNVIDAYAMFDLVDRFAPPYGIGKQTVNEGPKRQQRRDRADGDRK